jgi:hypothetical protein
MTAIAVISLTVALAATVDAAHTRWKLHKALDRLETLTTIRNWLSDDDLDWQADLDNDIPSVDQLRAMWDGEDPK